MKSRGFCLEQTHVTDPQRLKKLVALLAMAFCWAHMIGEWLIEQKPLKIKKHGRMARSIFRYGFDHLRRILCNLHVSYSTDCVSTSYSTFVLYLESLNMANAAGAAALFQVLLAARFALYLPLDPYV